MKSICGSEIVRFPSCGVAKWLKAQGLGPCHIGVRGGNFIYYEGYQPPRNIRVKMLMISVGWIRLAIVLASLCMTAVASAESIQITKTAFSPNETIQVHYEAPTNLSNTAWIGIIPSNVLHINESVNDRNALAWKFLMRKTSGTLLFNAPKQPGAYDLRMNDNDLDGNETASRSFMVVEESILNKSRYVVPITNDSSNVVPITNKSKKEISAANKSIKANVVPITNESSNVVPITNKSKKEISAANKSIKAKSISENAAISKFTDLAYHINPQRYYWPPGL